MPSQPKQAGPAAVDPAAPVVAPESAGVTFFSGHGALIVYHKGAKIAEFVGGTFTTDDPKIIAALRESDLCTEWTL